LTCRKAGRRVGSWKAGKKARRRVGKLEGSHSDVGKLLTGRKAGKWVGKLFDG